MADLNKVFLIGRLTHDPELRYTPNGNAVTDLRMATSRQYQGKDGSQQKEQLYIDVAVWNRQAENCCQFLKKGRLVHVEGYLKMDSWEDKQTGQPRTKIKVGAERVQFLDRRDESSGGGYSGGAGGEDEEFSPPAAPARRSMAEANGPSRGFGAPAGGAPPRRPAPPPSDADADDIPF